MSALVLREATLSEVETRQDWRYFDFSRGEADDTSGRANGGGFAYKYTDSTRCIVWYVIESLTKQKKAIRNSQPFQPAFLG